ncbi:ankyrin repeat domain-containing protein [Microbispora sp. NEAU-D428]|uniref:ankyrin repeat domain-containing protein n=1 Tax=Microbispora sitophila TaxID=2771537 RepID=UPI0018694A97|nr:ankyrin repeat domain-containing protein [Microbispora sitophila]MBE3010887.1 ankyrin repeat domain-containing protein [Microbispora sitophila]
MDATDDVGWWIVGYDGWTDLDLIRERLAAGADPNSGVRIFDKPLHVAAEQGSPEVVAELATRVDDVDAEHRGRTALWMAVFEGRVDNARVLVSAGADPWRPMMDGWSPGRLSLAGPTPDLFPAPSPEIGLSEAEAATTAEAKRLIPALGDFYYDGLSLACVADVSAAEAAARLEATPADDVNIDALYEAWYNVPDADRIVGITDVPGGCVITQPWGYTPDTPGLGKRVSLGTVCYSMYSNPKGGISGHVARDRTVSAWETHTAYMTPPDAPAEEILAAYLYRNHPPAFCCAGADLHLADARPITGLPGAWLQLPERDYWA